MMVVKLKGSGDKDKKIVPNEGGDFSISSLKNLLVPIKFVIIPHLMNSLGGYLLF